jgi:hypothetical protein
VFDGVDPGDTAAQCMINIVFIETDTNSTTVCFATAGGGSGEAAAAAVVVQSRSP